MSSRSRVLASLAVVATAAGAASGCTDVTQYSTSADQSYCGAIVDASFVRAGFPAGTTMRLVLDADRLRDAPGKLWTSAFGTGEALAGATLVGIPELSSDALSLLSFGDGRVKNSIVAVDSAGGPITVVLSLMQSGAVEVRLLRGSSVLDVDAAPGRPPSLFGVFQLSRQQGDCGMP
jgi:hypothetical protein